MAQRKPARTIRLPNQGAQPNRPTAPVPGPPSGRPTTGPIGGGGDVGRAMQDLEASATVRDRSQLPAKVKVITPQVIMNIVESITGNLGMSVDRDEFNKLVVEQTQAQMRVQQAQDRLEQYKAEYKKLYDAYQHVQETVKQFQAGQAGQEDFARQYEAQIAELKQRNAQAVDTYTSLQQQLDDTLGQFDALQAQVNDMDAALRQRDQEVAGLQQSLAEAQQGGAAVEQANAEVENLRQQVAELQQQLENTQTEAGVQAEQQVQALQQQLAQAEQAAIDAGQTAAAEAETLRAEIEELQRKVKGGQLSQAKRENIEVELEELRAAEGKWLEEKRRMASQLSNETNNRRAAEERLKAIEVGEALPAAAKAVEDRAKKAEAELDKLRGELQEARKQLDKAKTKATEAGAAADEVKKLKDELDKTRKELAKTEKNLADSGNAAKELGVIKRKFENVESELEELRAAEGKWLEEKRRMAAQLSNETNLRREAEEKLQDEIKKLSDENKAGKKKS